MRFLYANNILINQQWHKSSTQIFKKRKTENRTKQIITLTAL